MKWGFGEIDTFVGDLWELATVAVVSPVHTDLHPAGQNALDLVKRAGPDVERELRQKEMLALGHVCVTSAGALDCEKIVHIAVTSLSRRPTFEMFEEALVRALMLAYNNEIRSISIPAMYIEPGELPTAIMARMTVNIAMDHLTKARFPNRIVLVVPSDYVHNLFLSEIDRVHFGELPS